MHASTQTKLVPAVVLPLVNTVCGRRWGVFFFFSKPANVQLASFISKNRLNRQNDNRIQAAQKRPSFSRWLVAGRCWRDLSFSVGEAFICPQCGSSASMKKRHICLYMSNRRVSIGGRFLYQPVFSSTSSPDLNAPRHFSDNIGLFWLASRGGDDALFWKRRLEIVEKAAGRNRVEPYILIPISKT